MSRDYEAATFIAYRIAFSYHQPTLGHPSVGTGKAGGDLAALIMRLAQTDGAGFLDTLERVLADERVSKLGRNDDVRREAIEGYSSVT